MRLYSSFTLVLASVALLCSCGSESPPAKFTIGGTLTGMAPNTSLTLTNNATDQLVVTDNGAFVFSTALAGNYSVSIKKNPYWQSCSVTNGSGTASQNVSSISVTCVEANANVTTVYAKLENGNPAGFDDPSDVALDSAGNVFVTDSMHNSIRKISPTGLVTTTLAGPFPTGWSAGSSDGIGAAASFNYPIGIAIDGTGNVFVADSYNHTIRKITPAGVVTTIAGTAGVGGSNDGTGAAALFNTPTDVAVDVDGNLYVADYGNYTIRKISPAGVVTTIAGTVGVAGSIDAIGSAASFTWPGSIAVDVDGNLFVGDGKTIRKISPSGMVTTIAGSSSAGPDSVDGTGNAARFATIYDIEIDTKGNLLVVDGLANTVRKITPNAVVTTVAGTARTSGHVDGVGVSARFTSPSGLAIDSDGNIYIADTFNKAIRKISPLP